MLSYRYRTVYRRSVCGPLLLHCSEAVRLHKCKITRCSRNHLILPFEHRIGCYIVHCISLIILRQASRYLWPVTSIGSKKHFDFNILLLGVCISCSRGLLTVAEIKRELSIRKSFSTSRHSFAVYSRPHTENRHVFRFLYTCSAPSYSLYCKPDGRGGCVAVCCSCDDSSLFNVIRHHCLHYNDLLSCNHYEDSKKDID